MANSKYEYVKNFEQPDNLLAECWLVVRVDGRGFHKFSDAHQFTKPNDERGLKLMNKCAEKIMLDTSDVLLAYGDSDEYSFVLKRSTTLFGRRASKLATVFASGFASSYVFFWKEFFPDVEIQYPPCFDGRVVVYPNDKVLKDYLAWRQVDCHINNLYNTTFWCLVHSGQTTKEAEKTLQGTLSEHKNEILFSQFNINYSTLPIMYRRGTTLLREHREVKVKETEDGTPVFRRRAMIVENFESMIDEKFWKDHPELLAD